MIRAAIGFVLSLALCAALMPFVISVLGKHRAAQPILGYVESHKAKSGTPTMGGVGFLVSAALPFAFLLRGDPSTALVCLIVAVGYGAIGLTDDIMKVKSGHNKGLSAGWKLLLQFLVACAVSAYAVFGSPVGTTILAPFTDKPLDLSWFALPYYVFVFLAFTNSVNLTDGLDGLAASVTEVFLMCFAAVLIICAGFAPTDTQLNELLLIACFAGALAGFLCYNRYPARVFMGDTGSLSLGGLLASLSVLTGLGLSAAIINPLSQEMTKTYKSYCALAGYDENCLDYIAYAGSVQREKVVAAPSVSAVAAEGAPSLKYYVEKGLKDRAEGAAAELLKTVSPLDVINGEIIPALDEVGKAFENKTLFLPQLLMSAEAASGAFDVIKRAFGGGGEPKKLKIVIATVRGDIHDIGKNIVRTLLENYGFTVYDMGRDVPARTIADKAKSVGAHVVGLSALMTTTVASMKETIELLKAELPDCRTLVGGAVLTAEYAAMIGATKYAKDAMASVRYCEELEGELFGDK